MFVLSQSFHQDVVSHASNVEDVKSAAVELIQTQPSVRAPTQQTTGD